MKMILAGLAGVALGWMKSDEISDAINKVVKNLKK